MIYNYPELSFQILSVGYYKHVDGVFNVAARPYAALSFRVSGRALIEVQNKSFISLPEDVLFLPSGAPYIASYQQSESIVVHFKSSNYEEAESFSVGKEAGLSARFTTLLDEWQRRHCVNAAKRSIYDVLERIESAKQAPSEDAAFLKCITFIDSHSFDPNLRIDEVCRQSFISPSTLQRAFHARLGISPKQYLMQRRLQHALELLGDGKLTVKEISYLSGFSDEKYFSRAFCRHFGYPPSQMKNKMYF